MPGDFPLPISDRSVDAAWPQVEQEPVNLIALLAPSELDSSTPPLMLEQAVSMLSQTAASEFTVVDHPPLTEGAAWAALIAGPALPAPMVIWIAPLKPLSDETLEFLKAGRVKWTIGVETMLESNRAPEHLLSVIQLLGRTFTDSPAVLNVNTGAWHTREELDNRLLPEGTEVSPSLMWIVHAIGNDSADPDKQPHLWAYTQGRWSAGLAELEMHGIPVPQGRAAVSMLNAICELLYESGLPSPGEPYEVGSDLWVRFLPWEQAAAADDPEWFGSTDNRKDHEDRPTNGARLAVCAIDSTMWPADVARKIERGEAALFKTHQATELDARQARQTLDDFRELFALVPPKHRKDTPQRLAAFLVKAGFAVPRNGQSIDNGEDREHLWFETLHCEAGRVHGRLVNQPLNIKHLQPGCDIWIDRELISDWQVITQAGEFGPEHHKLARQALERLIQESANA
jgi:uncharacterized protein YegJ (DUF2314 family)